MAESEELKSFLMKVKDENEKNSTFRKLKLWHMVPWSYFSLHGKIDGETVETVRDFIS